MGLLDELFNPTIRGGLPWTLPDPPKTKKEEEEAIQMGAPFTSNRYTDVARPVEIDYSSGVPMPYLGGRFSGKQRPEDVWDPDLARSRSSEPVNPIPPEQLPNFGQQDAVPGLLSGQQSIFGNPQPQQPPMQMPQPGSPVAALPPPVQVPDLPQPPQAAPQGPGMNAQAAMPGQAPGMAPGMPPGQPPATDISAQSRQGGMPPGEAPRGLLQRLDEFTTKNPALLFALAAGFSGAPSFGTGMSRAFGNAGGAMAQDQKLQLQQGGIGSTYRALVANGVPPQLALAAAQNPTILQQIAPSYLADRKSEIKSIKSKDQFGNESERLVAVNPYDFTTKDITPGGGGEGGGGRVSTNAVLAPGITAIDNSKVGDDYLKQFSPEVQAGVKAYMSGASMPTGRQQLAQTIKMIAQKYGDDVGVPANDQAYNQKKEWATSLANTKSGVGLQARGFQQGLNHMLELSQKLVKLGNSSGMGLEPIAEWTNYFKNMTTGQRDIAEGVGTSAQALSGEVGKLYSGSQGGGVHEREATTQRLGDVNKSPQAAAGALEATLELMDGGLRPLEQRRDELFGQDPRNHPRGSEFIGPEQQRVMNEIRKNIAALRGGTANATGAAPASSTSGQAGGLNWRIVTP